RHPVERRAEPRSVHQLGRLRPAIRRGRIRRDRAAVERAIARADARDFGGRRALGRAGMTNNALVFALEIGYRDAVPDADNSDVLATPTLYAFSNAAVAAASNEGLTIVEGDLWFFASEGSPLEALFSEQPYVYPDRPSYFPGRYSLQAGR